MSFSGLGCTLLRNNPFRRVIIKYSIIGQLAYPIEDSSGDGGGQESRGEEEGRGSMKMRAKKKWKEKRGPTEI